MTSPQIDNGNFTRIHNEILEHLVSSNLNGTELAVVLHIIRKTYGFQKLQDEISLSQFCNAIPSSKVTICNALRNLQLVKILQLVKKGNSKICSNLWLFNKDYDTWQLVKKSKLVKIFVPTSKDFDNQLVKKTLHTKEIYKRNTKERNFVPPSLAELEEYVKRNEYNVDSQQWLNFYESKGWMVGKNKMKDWKAGVRAWANRNKGLLNINSLAQEAMDLVKQCEAQYGYEEGSDIAMFRFKAKYPKEDILKYKGIFKI